MIQNLHALLILSMLQGALRRLARAFDSSPPWSALLRWRALKGLICVEPVD